MATTRTMVVLVAGFGAAIALASGAYGSAPPVARASTPRRSAAPKKKRASSTAPEGEVTLGPITQIITSKSGAVTKKTDLTSLTPSELTKYKAQLAKTGDSDNELLTDDQARALEDESVERARASMPGASASQQERAKLAAQRAAQQMGKRTVPPLPKVPANPSVTAPPVRVPSAPLAYVSPPTPINLELARREAPALAKHLRAKGVANYSRQSVRDFQAHAGLTVDGIYGPLTASALKYFGVSNAPAPFFKAKIGSVVTYAPAN